MFGIVHMPNLSHPWSGSVQCVLKICNDTGPQLAPAPMVTETLANSTAETAAIRQLMAAPATPALAKLVAAVAPRLAIEFASWRGMVPYVRSSTYNRVLQALLRLACSLCSATPIVNICRNLNYWCLLRYVTTAKATTPNPFSCSNQATKSMHMR